MQTIPNDGEGGGAARRGRKGGAVIATKWEVGCRSKAPGLWGILITGAAHNRHRGDGSVRWNHEMQCTFRGKKRGAGYVSAGGGSVLCQ